MINGLKDASLLCRGAFIDNHWVDADDQKTYGVFNPATGEKITDVSKCGASETETAIASAYTAFFKWRELTAKQRAAYLRKWFNLVLDSKDDLALILTTEQGKPLSEAMGEVAYGASYIEWFAEESKRVYGDTIPQPSNDKRIICIKQPVGVVACITPWNFPNAMLSRKIAPALAAGCTVVCKPANETPLSAFALAELASRAGIPPGVINMVTGHTESIGGTLTGSPKVRKLTFTGSTAVGKKLQADCAPTMKRTSMELGGNAPFIVFDDADIGAAVTGAIASKYRNAGQTCVCANRFLIQKRVYQEFAKKFAEAASKLKVGNGLDNDTDIGPLINGKAVQDVDDLIRDSIKHGAEILVGGHHTELGNLFLEPTIISNTHNRMKICSEEIFGPVAPLICFETEEEAIQIANDTDVGLASYMYTRDIGRCIRVAERLEYGMVGINEGIISNEMAPFGGVKYSGQGREGSKYGLDDYLEIKYMCIGGIES
ncbi:MAG: NAD-dependent succinate-semialdehyde dehydrogenase [Gammaproteobacteria bacterium]|nr:NAD-dependent succinate-semialdehyde dehydrogenase [Gammaproteobacteria bacterium]